MDCRVGCGACCIAPSISSPMPGMPHGKPAGVRCPHLTHDHRCALYGRPERPELCMRLRASEEMCGQRRGRRLCGWHGWSGRHGETDHLSLQARQLTFRHIADPHMRVSRKVFSDAV